ncbi:metallophosphoesterase family protein [Streptomyces sp. NBC_01264]|uniref:metallophosphoesterase family protein n=1 Tax=Streptomyces sp. NBC_01264 TaxID=2903804 RepID=UPI00224F4590|nr:metallophosphoesterase [Streptomyces sp. NBC_01264]MCX4783643.1 metallophosphoesterase [Streptomyces sp. NBC_01264]
MIRSTGATPEGPSSPGSLLAVSDLHVRYEENRAIVESLRPSSEEDWLLVAGDVGEHMADIEWALSTLAGRFRKVVWAPGNHELWTPPDDPVQARGVARYEALVQLCRSLGVTTPEDPYPVWRGAGGPAVIVPLFLLYDYSFRRPDVRTTEEALRRAADAGVVATDEFLLHPDPYPSVGDWCRARLRRTADRLDALPADLPTVLVSHFPLVREPTEVLHYPDFALWCGTEATADWPVRYRAAAVVYGHLHIPRLIRKQGIPHYEVSLGYPREWRRRPGEPGHPLQVLPAPAPSGRQG